MFDLNKAIDQWAKKVVSHDIWDADKIEELKDHLYCIIEEDMKSGATEQQAFERATSALGYPASTESDSLSGKTRVVKSICRVLNKIEGNPSAESPLMIANAIIWACVMLAMAIVIDDKDTNQSVLTILIAGWFASYLCLDGTKRSAKQEWACLKRRFMRTFS